MPYFKDDNVHASAVILSGDIPLQIISQIKIPNLNASFLDGKTLEEITNISNFTGILPATAFSDTTHGQRSGGLLHALANDTTAGFISPEEKQKLSSIQLNVNVGTTPYSSIIDSDGNIASAGASTNPDKELQGSQIKFRSNNINYLSIQVASNDFTHGDNVLFTLNTAKIIEDVLNSVDITYVNVSTNITLQKNHVYFVDSRISSLIFGIYSTPIPGDFFEIIDVYGYFGINSVILQTNKFQTVNDTVELSIPGKKYTITYVDSTFGWKIN